MLDKKIRILDLDGSVAKQNNLLARYDNEVIGLKDLGPLARHWCSRKTRSLIEGRISGSARNTITFIGSGDYHHISEILIDQFKEPISLICFDYHPDWTALPPRYGCGSWVTEVLKKKNVRKAVLFGASSEDLSSFNIQSGSLGAFKDDRLEIFPFAHEPSRVFLRKIWRNSSIKSRKGVFSDRIFWTQIKEGDMAGLFEAALKRVPTKEVYVSIDKDCLKNDYALTNWEEGVFSLEQLLSLLALIKKNKRIIGLDITGDYSIVSVKGLARKITVYLDHPRLIKAGQMPQAQVNSINEGTNIKLVDFINS